MSAQAVSEFRRRRKKNLIRVCGEKCCLCGYNKTISALEFHHIHPEMKKFGIASGNCHNLEDDLLEIKKCVLVCANCHREIHDGLYSDEELEHEKIFIDSIADELRQEREEKKYYCKSCGKELSQENQSKLCRECYKKSQRENRPSRLELKEMIRTMPFTKIGERFGVSDNAIRKWCKAENLPTKKTEIQKLTDAQWEEI